MGWREELVKFSLSQYVKLHLKFSVDKNLSPYNFEKARVPLGWPNRYKFYSSAWEAELRTYK